MSYFSRKQKDEGQALVVVEEAPRRPPPCENARLVEEWIGSKASLRTQTAYRKDATRFLAHAGDKPLNWVTLQDLSHYQQQALAGQSPASIARRISAIKSLLTFGCTLYPGFFPVNVGAALKLKKGKDTLAERILSEETVLDLLSVQRRATEDRYRERNAVLLRLLYKAALRREEVCQLSWRDVQDREHGQGQLTVYGKGGKTRPILIEDESLYRALKALRGTAGDNAPVFVSRQRSGSGEKRLSPDQVYRIVRKAAERAGINKPVSPHWMRHAHASHALDNGAPITLVRDTLGHSSLQVTSRYSHARPNASSGQYLKG